MDAAFCVAALKEALARDGKPAIFNPDPGSRFIGSDFAGILATAGIEISMDGRGRFMATVFARRFLTHEAISLDGDADGRAAQDGISLGLEFSQGAFVGRLHRARGDRRKMPVRRAGTAPAKARDMMANAALLSIMPTAGHYSIKLRSTKPLARSPHRNRRRQNPGWRDRRNQGSGRVCPSATGSSGPATPAHFTPLIVAEIEFGQISLQMSLADVVIRPIDRALHDGKVALNGVGVNVAANVIASTLVDGTVQRKLAACRFS